MPTHEALTSLLHALHAPEPWDEGDNIPWHDPDFSGRMLYEHLDQNHDRASRRFYVVDRHVAWLQDFVIKATPTHILDLGCGPGLYCHRLAQLGHICTGIDYSPASIGYARAEASEQGLACEFIEGDIRTTDYPGDQQLIMLLFGELNVFRPGDAETILTQAHAALTPQGQVVLEAHTSDAIRRSGEVAPSWYVAESGLFGATPHLVLQQAFWSEAAQASTIRYFVVELNTGQLTRYAQTLQAYSINDYRTLLARCGFDQIEVLPALSDDPTTADPDFLVLVAQK
ncbi:MAG: class I SAM-dependent methyltransferase [Litorilinea sp.]